MSLSYTSTNASKWDGHFDRHYNSLMDSDNDYEDTDYSMHNIDKNNHNSTTSPSSKTNSSSLDSQKYNHNIMFSSSSNTSESMNNNKYLLLTRSSSVVIHDDFAFESFYDIINQQLLAKEEEEKQEEEEDVAKYKEEAKEEQKNILCDNFTVKDLSNWLLIKKQNKFKDDYITCKDEMHKLKECKKLTIEQINKQLQVAQIKHYMTEYYKLLEEQNANNVFNPLRTIRDRELKLQTHHLTNAESTNNLSDTTKNFKRLMRNYQNVIKDPPSIPVLAFTNRYDVRDSPSSGEKDKNTNKGYYGNEGKHNDDKKNNDNHHYHYRLNYGNNSKKPFKYQYWKWFVGVNERYEDITIQKIIHLKQDFAGKPQESAFLAQINNRPDLIKDSRTTSADLSVLEELALESDEDDNLDNNCELETESLNEAENKGSCNKFMQKIQDTVDWLEIREQGKLEKILYLEAILKILIQKSHKFQYENDKHYKKLSSFEIPSIDCLTKLIDETKIEIPTCEKLTKISEDNELTNMGIQLTSIQSEINTTLQLRLKKITMNDDQANVDDLDEKSSDGTFKRSRHGNNESKITRVGFFIIELTIKLILITIKILYSIYSLFTFSKKESSKT